MTDPNTGMLARNEATGTKKPGPALGLSIVIFLVGAVLVSVGSVMILNGVLESSTVDSFAVPGQQSRELDPGPYDVFGSAGGVTNFSASSSFSASDVTVTNADTGEAVVVSSSGSIDVSINRQTNRYERVGVFTVTEAGSYTFEVAPPDGAESRAVVARSFVDSVDELVMPGILIGIGTLIGLIGVIMIVVGIVRRGRSDRARRGPGASPGIYQAPPATTPAPTTPAPPNNAGQSETNTPW